MTHRILVIDDAEDHADYVMELLRRANYRPISVRSGDSTIDDIISLQGTFGIDLIITDLFMPKPDGIEILRFANQCLPGVPVIGISGGNKMMLNGMARLGATYVLEKPIDGSKLLDLVKSATPRRATTPQWSPVTA